MMRDFVWKRSDSACEALKKKKNEAYMYVVSDGLL